ncbi:MAG: spermidine synthase-like protein [Gemmatimonadota bacterium]
MTPNVRLSLSVGAASAAILAFQIVVMQLLSISQWHHFAYMVISMALLGFGAAGTALVLLRRFLSRHYEQAVPLLYLATGVSMATSVWLSGLAGDFDAFLLFFEPGQLGLLVVSYLVYFLPFFFGGLAVTLIFYREVDRIGTLYFANMVGSGIGAVGVIALLWALPPESLPGVLALLPVLAAWLTRPPSTSLRVLAGAVLVALLVPAVAIVRPSVPEPSEYKPIHGALLLPGAEVVYRASSPYGLLEVVRAEAQRFAPSLSLQYRDEPPVRDVAFNNGEYYGTLLGRAGPEQGHILDHTTRGLPYAVRRPGSVLVLGAATGTDVSLALGHGAARVTAVEPHRQANRLLTDVHPEWIDDFYGDPSVRLFGTSARTHLGRRTDETHDLIVPPVLGGFGGTSGVDALSEQYLLTVEGFTAMWDVLTVEGMIALTLWEDQPPRNTLRVLSTWREVLTRQGIDDLEAHIAAVRSWGTVTYLLSKRPWTAEEVQRIRGFASGLGFDPLILAGVADEARDRFNRLPDRALLDAIDTLLAGDPSELFERYPFDVRPTTDDRPFFAHFVKWSSIPELHEAYGARELPYLELGFVLGVVTFVQIVLVALALIVLPLFRIPWEGTRRRWTFLYFAGTGVGFMLFEIVLIQKLVLYLGLPVYAAAAVLTTLLISSGAGSLASSKLDATGRTLALVGATVVGLILVYAWGLRPVLELSMGWSLPPKAVAVFLLLAPPAFVMGMMFPLGLRRLAGSDETHIPWACGIDSSLSVSATAIATLMALETGFGAVMLTAAAAYGLVALAGPRLGRVG